MQEKPDVQLLRAYVNGDEAAFREIVSRHGDLVYSAALRQVNSPDLAQDITQSVFVDLVRKAREVGERLAPDASLAGWLYRSTRFAVLNRLRDDHRRAKHERQAMEQLITDSSPTPDWERIRPILDEAMAELSDDDRDAIVLRYFKNHDFQTVGRAIGLTDDAAQKRVSRAVERLREFFSKRGVAMGASGLVVIISANAVHAAPLTLAASISTAAVLAGTTIHTSTALTATKVIAMTTLQKTLVTATLAAVAGTGMYEAHQASQLREQVQTLQQRQAPLTAQLQQLQQERDDATNQLASLTEELEKLKNGNLESLRLQNEIAFLKQSRDSTQKAVNTASTATDAIANSGTAPVDGRELGAAVVRGEAGAFDKLLAESKAEHQYFKSNTVGLDDAKQNELSVQTFAEINAAFKVIEEAAVSGNASALDALNRSLQIPELRGLAVHSLGQLAANGDAGALEILLHPEKYGALLSSTISQLQPAADNGNQGAIDALAAVAKDQKSQSLWNMTANSLAKAAAAGNPVAIDALINMSSTTNRTVQNAVAEALRGAAANQNAKAADTLRSMGQ